MTMMFCFLFFFFNDTATTEIYTLSLHDALPIWAFVQQRTLPMITRWPGFRGVYMVRSDGEEGRAAVVTLFDGRRDRKSTRLNSSHANISYAVFCLKKKKINNINSCDIIT